MRAHVRTVGTEAAAMTAAPAMAEALALLLVAVAVDVGLLRLRAAAGDEGRQAVHIGAFRRLRERLLLRRLVLRAVVLLLVARRERLRVARQIRLLLRLLRLRLLRLRRVGLVLAEERLAVVIVVEVVSRALLLRGAGLLLLRVVVRVLLPELFLRGGDEAEIVLGVLIVIFSRDRVAGALRVARELDVFFCDVRGSAADFNVGPVRLVDARQRILALAVTAAIVATPHALLTVSHDVPVRRPFALPRRLRRLRVRNRKSIRNSWRSRTCSTSAPRAKNFASVIALTAATP